MNLTPRKTLSFAIRPYSSASIVFRAGIGSWTDKQTTATDGSARFADTVGAAAVGAAKQNGPSIRRRAALVTAFIAKAVMNLSTTRDLIGRLRVDEALWTFCG
jgi:hypothetical protein